MYVVGKERWVVRYRHWRIAAITLALVGMLSFLPTLALAAPVATERVNTYMIALDDGGKTGEPIGCGDSLVPVPIDVAGGATTEIKITQALTKLFSFHDRDYGESGLINALAPSQLRVDKIALQGSTAAVYLSGTISLGGVCDTPRVSSQISATATQFPGVQRAIIVINGGPIDSAAGEIAFPETGHRVASPFYPFWEVQGGLPIFGYPLTDQLVEGGYRVQYFERNRFEAHPENQAPYNVLFGLVGSETAARRNLIGTAPFGRKSASNQQGCEYFAATGHNVCGKFLTYWHGHGLDFGENGVSARESLALFGFPISEPFEEKLENGNTYTVQYFERVRMELHPENPAPYDVLLGRVTADLVPAK
jgi:hypothetical protein